MLHNELKRGKNVIWWDNSLFASKVSTFNQHFMKNSSLTKAQDKEEKVSKKVSFSQTKIDFSLLYFGYAVSDFTKF